MATPAPPLSCSGVLDFTATPSPSYTCYGIRRALSQSAFPPRAPTHSRSVCIGYSVYRESPRGQEGCVCAAGLQFIVGREKSSGNEADGFGYEEEDYEDSSTVASRDYERIKKRMDSQEG